MFTKILSDWEIFSAQMKGKSKGNELKPKKFRACGGLKDHYNSVIQFLSVKRGFLTFFLLKSPRSGEIFFGRFSPRSGENFLGVFFLLN